MNTLVFQEVIQEMGSSSNFIGNFLENIVYTQRQSISPGFPEISFFSFAMGGNQYYCTENEWYANNMITIVGDISKTKIKHDPRVLPGRKEELLVKFRNYIFQMTKARSKVASKLHYQLFVPSLSFLLLFG